MRFQVLYHDRCFDGAASAALFGKFLEDHHGPGVKVSYRGVSHAANFTWKPQQFEADEIAILDFRYCPHPCVTWWFDHHQSAFLTAEDEEHFRRCSSDRMVLDTTYSSCARLVADSLGRAFEYRAPKLEQLVDWADIVDGAKYPNARAAVEISSPMNRLRLVLEQSNEAEFRKRIVRKLGSTPIGEVLDEPRVQDRVDRLVGQHLRAIDVMRRHAEYDRRVVYFDLSKCTRVPFSKFIPYFLFPEAQFAVALTRSIEGLKISLGSNPWHRQVQCRNLAALAEKFGGGGHSYVAGITLEHHAGEDARALAQVLVQELRGDPKGAECA